MSRLLVFFLVLINTMTLGAVKCHSVPKMTKIELGYFSPQTPTNFIRNIDGHIDTSGQWIMYFKQKDSIIDFEYYSLYDTDISFFMPLSAKRVQMELATEGLLNETTPILIRYKSVDYQIKTPIEQIVSRLPVDITYGTVNGYLFIVVGAERVGHQPPAGKFYLVLKFKNDKLVKYKDRYFKEEISFEEAIKGI